MVEEESDEIGEDGSRSRNRDMSAMDEQAKIKQAVSEYTTEQDVPDQNQMQPSMLTQGGGVIEMDEPQPNYQQPQYQDYQQYQPTSLSSDTIMEIAEQVVSDKLSSIRKGLEQTRDMRTSIEANLNALDDRLKRIEKVIDRLQLSVLQKVGDYVNNVEDIKKELVETQKSFKSMHEMHKKSQQK